MISCLTLLASFSDVKASSLKCESRMVAQQEAGSSCIGLQVRMDFLIAPRNLKFYVVGKLLMCSFSEFIAGIANPRTLGIKKNYFTYNYEVVC